jgi:hypothetical protein
LSIRGLVQIKGGKQNNIVAKTVSVIPKLKERKLKKDFQKKNRFENYILEIKFVSLKNNSEFTEM